MVCDPCMKDEMRRDLADPTLPEPKRVPSNAAARRRTPPPVYTVN
jgi:hypothetical protein